MREQVAHNKSEQLISLRSLLVVLILTSFHSFPFSDFFLIQLIQLAQHQFMVQAEGMCYINDLCYGANSMMFNPVIRILE